MPSTGMIGKPPHPVKRARDARRACHDEQIRVPHVLKNVGHPATRPRKDDNSVPKGRQSVARGVSPWTTAPLNNEAPAGRQTPASIGWSPPPIRQTCTVVFGRTSAPALSFLSPLWGLVPRPFAFQGLTPLATNLGSSGARTACPTRPVGDRLAGAGWPRLFQSGGPELAPASTLRSSRCALGSSNAEPHAWQRTTTSRFVSPTF